MCEVCVDVARLNNTPYTLSSVVSLLSEIDLSARGFQCKLTLVLTIKYLFNFRKLVSMS